MNIHIIVFILVGSVIFSCAGQKNHESGDKFRREEKFAISDRVEGRWRPGSDVARKLVDSLFVTAMYPLIHELGIPKERIVLLPSHRFLGRIYSE